MIELFNNKKVLEIYNLKTNQLETRFVYYLESLREIKNNILYRMDWPGYCCFDLNKTSSCYASQIK